jgi:hypothetical protein
MRRSDKIATPDTDPEPTAPETVRVRMRGEVHRVYRGFVPGYGSVVIDPEADIPVSVFVAIAHMHDHVAVVLPDPAPAEE